ncbi:kinase-like domain-containing protein [Syncephalis plumigaleata]|nr:kinase-like domain-containing protein [Syncephalis plumigaleata]
MLTKYAGDQTLGEYFDGSIYGKERTAYRLFYQLLEGLQFLHRARLTHSDININNVMIGIDGNGTPKPTIVDFDTSTSFSVFNLRRPRKRIQGMPLAHPAPEFFSSSSYNLYKFDMWLLAATFYQMTMNKPPIEGTIAGQSLS